RPQEGEGSAVVVARYDSGEHGVLDTKGGAHVMVVGPRLAAVMRDCDVRMAVPVLVAEIEGAIRADAYGRVAETRQTGRHSANRPGQAVVRRDDDRLSGMLHGRAPARFVGNVHGPVRRHLD